MEKYPPPRPPARKATAGSVRVESFSSFMGQSPRQAEAEVRPFFFVPAFRSFFKKVPFAAAVEPRFSFTVEHGMSLP